MSKLKQNDRTGWQSNQAFLCDLGDDEGVADEDWDVGDDLDEDDLGPHSVQQEVPMVEAKVWKDASDNDDAHFAREIDRDQLD